jgi:hypothetical protein
VETLNAADVFANGFIYFMLNFLGNNPLVCLRHMVPLQHTILFFTSSNFPIPSKLLIPSSSSLLA